MYVYVYFVAVCLHHSEVEKHWRVDQMALIAADAEPTGKMTVVKFCVINTSARCFDMEKKDTTTLINQKNKPNNLFCY